MVIDAQSYPEKRFDKIKRETFAETDDENLVNASNMKEESVDFLSGKNLIVYDPSSIPECTVRQRGSDLFLKYLLELRST